MKIAKTFLAVLAISFIFIIGVGCTNYNLSQTESDTSETVTFASTNSDELENQSESLTSNTDEAANQTESATLVQYDDPVAYCAAVGTVDQPDAQYTGTDMPETIVRSMIAQALVSTDAPPEIQQNGVWRCMDDQVWVCHYGANLPCLEKADTSETPSSAMEMFCQENPGAENIPAVVTGQATVYEWGCEEEEPKVIQQIFESDSQGYLAEFWHELTLNSVSDTKPITTEEPVEEISQTEPTATPVEEVETTVTTKTEAATEPDASATVDENPRNDFMPVSPIACQAIQETAAEILSTSFEIELSVPFEDPFTRKAGLACQLTTRGTGNDFPFPRKPLNDLADTFNQWSSLLTHQADGPTGAVIGLEKDLAFMLISSDWDPTPDAECPSDQPISVCELTPEQQLYTINIMVARETNETIIESAGAEQYIPVSLEVCQTVQEIANKTLSTSFEMEARAPFTDPQSGETGLGCTLTAIGTEADLDQRGHFNRMLRFEPLKEDCIKIDKISL